MQCSIQLLFRLCCTLGISVTSLLCADPSLSIATQPDYETVLAEVQPHSIKQTISNSSIMHLDEERKELAPFKKIRIEGNFKINLIQGLEHSITLQGDKQAFSQLITRVDKENLTIRTKKLRKNMHVNASTDPLILNITSPELEKIAIFGSNQVSSAALKTKDLLIETKGSIVGNFNVDTTQVRCKAIGACDLIITGSTTDSLLSLDGSGAIHAGSLQSENTKILLRGSGQADIQVQNKLNVNIYGSGQVHYTGHPKVHSSLFGSGQVTAMDHSVLPDSVAISQR